MYSHSILIDLFNDCSEAGNGFNAKERNSPNFEELSLNGKRTVYAPVLKCRYVFVEKCSLQAISSGDKISYTGLPRLPRILLISHSAYLLLYCILFDFVVQFLSFYQVRSS